MVVLTRSQLESYSKDQLIEELLNISTISTQMEELKNRFDDFIKKIDVISSELAVVKTCNDLLRKKIVKLERNGLNAS